jgi:predicted nicotinamide N-methyase
VGEIHRDVGRDRSSAYEKVIELCRRVHATCVRQIPLTHTTIAPTTITDTIQLPETNSISTSSSTVTTEEDSAFSAYALESPGYLGIAGKVWDSMYVLLQYLAIHQEEFVRGKRIVELGCGTGLAGALLFWFFIS